MQNSVIYFDIYFISQTVGISYCTVAVKSSECKLLAAAKISHEEVMIVPIIVKFKYSSRSTICVDTAYI